MISFFEIILLSVKNYLALLKRFDSNKFPLLLYDFIMEKQKKKTKLVMQERDSK